MKRFYISIFVLGLIAAGILIYRYEIFNLKDVGQARLVINGQEFSVEIADTSAEQKLGLSGRDFLEPNKSLLFIFNQPGNYGFWMKDMKFAIDIIWIKDGRIIGFEKNAAPESYPKMFYPPSPADKVLEVVAGTVVQFKFMVGDEVKVL